MVVQQRFVFYTTTFKVDALQNRDMPSQQLRDYSARAYNEMRQQWPSESHLPIGHGHKLPPMMTAMWIPSKAQVILASSVKGPKGQFAYHPDNVPPQVTQLLRLTALSGNWATDHRQGGSCGEIACLAMYYNENPMDKNLKYLDGLKFLTTGVPTSVYNPRTRIGNPNAPPTVQNPCTGTFDERGCRDFFYEAGIRWCGPAAWRPEDNITKRDNSTNSELLSCFVPNPPPAAISDTVYAMTASVPVSSFNVTASVTPDATISIPSDDSVSMVTGDADDLAAASDGGAAAPSGLTTSPSPSATGPIDASTVLGDETKEGSACLQECVAGFDSCPAPQNNNQRRHWWQANERSVNSVDCFTLANCYLVQPPWQAPSAPTPGTNTNPEDPNAQAGPAAKPQIDMEKVNGVCSDVSTFLALLVHSSWLSSSFMAWARLALWEGHEQQECESLMRLTQACDNIENGGARDGQGKPYNLDSLWNCLKAAQAGP